MSQPAAHPLIELVKARLREFLREPGYVFWVFGFPLLLAVGLGLAFREKTPEPPRVAVVAEIESKRTKPLFESKQLNAQSLARAEAQRALARNKVDLLVDAEGKKIVLHFDPKADRSALARAVVDDVLQRGAGRRDLVSVRDQTALKQGERYIDFLLPGLIGMNLMGSSMWGIGFNLVTQRKRRLLRRYAVTPMRRSHFLLAFVITRSLFLVFELALLVGFGKLIFGTQMQGSVGAFIVTSTLGAGAFAGISLMVGARLDNTEIANGWLNFVQLPMWLLSGPFFSYERFPEALQLPIRFLPLTALNDALRAIYNDAASLTSLGFQLAVLSGWAVLGFAVALRTFRWQ